MYRASHFLKSLLQTVHALLIVPVDFVIVFFAILQFVFGFCWLSTRSVDGQV